jgi:hypothetical protein
MFKNNILLNNMPNKKVRGMTKKQTKYKNVL